MVDRSVRAIRAFLTVATVVVPVHAGAQQPPAPAPAGVTAKPPLLNRANELLPQWFRLRGEFRERMEGFDGLGFNSTREDLYWLSRLRLNATMTPSTQLSFQAQVQDARVAKKTVGPTGAPFKAPIDLRMAFADVGSTTGPVTVRAGRQELVSKGAGLAFPIHDGVPVMLVDEARPLDG